MGFSMVKVFEAATSDVCLEKNEDPSWDGRFLQGRVGERWDDLDSQAEKVGSGLKARRNC